MNAVCVQLYIRIKAVTQHIHKAKNIKQIQPVEWLVRLVMPIQRHRQHKRSKKYVQQRQENLYIVSKSNKTKTQDKRAFYSRFNILKSNPIQSLNIVLCQHINKKSKRLIIVSNTSYLQLNHTLQQDLKYQIYNQIQVKVNFIKIGIIREKFMSCVYHLSNDFYVCLNFIFLLIYSGLYFYRKRKQNIFYPKSIIKKRAVPSKSMGNSQVPRQNNQQFQISHEKFKNIEISQGTNQMTLTIPFEQSTDIKEWQKLLKEIKGCDEQFLLLPKKYRIVNEGICGTSGLVKIVYDEFTYSFDQQIKNHAEKHTHFEQPEIWYLLFAILSAIVEMDGFSRKVGDIRPYNIFVNQNGQVKTAGVYSWPKQIQNTLKTSYDRVVTYLAPEQLLLCRSGQKSKSSYIAGESFSVGLTLLHSCLLKSQQNLYNVKKFEFNSQRLQHQISSLKKLTFWNNQKEKKDRYSEELIAVIQRLLQLDQSKRLNTLHLYSALQPYAEQILNLRPFEIPHFITNQMQRSQNNNTKKASRLSQIQPQYSSIKKKQYNEPQSMGLEMSIGLGPVRQHSVKQAQTNTNAFQRMSLPKRIPQKTQQNIILNTQNVSYAPRTVHYPRQQTVSNQKYNSNPVVINNKGQRTSSQQKSHSFYNKQLNNANNSYSIHPQVNFQHNIQPHSYYPPQSQSYYVQVPINQQNSYTHYQRPIEQTSQSKEQYVYRGASQPANFFYTSQYNQTINGNKVPVNGHNFNIISSNYPINQRNVNLATSGYTYRKSLEKDSQNKSKQGFFINNLTQNRQAINRSNENVTTSYVRPLNGQNQIIKKDIQYQSVPKDDQNLELLKKIDEQLNKSRQMYPSRS